MKIKLIINYDKLFFAFKGAFKHIWIFCTEVNLVCSCWVLLLLTCVIRFVIKWTGLDYYFVSLEVSNLGLLFCDYNTGVLKCGQLNTVRVETPVERSTENLKRSGMWVMKHFKDILYTNKLSLKRKEVWRRLFVPYLGVLTSTYREELSFFEHVRLLLNI